MSAPASWDPCDQSWAGAPARRASAPFGNPSRIATKRRGIPRNPNRQIDANWKTYLGPYLWVNYAPIIFFLGKCLSLRSTHIIPHFYAFLLSLSHIYQFSHHFPVIILLQIDASPAQSMFNPCFGCLDLDSCCFSLIVLTWIKRNPRFFSVSIDENNANPPFSLVSPSFLDSIFLPLTSPRSFSGLATFGSSAVLSLSTSAASAASAEGTTAATGAFASRLEAPEGNMSWW